MTSSLDRDLELDRDGARLWVADDDVTGAGPGLGPGPGPGRDKDLDLERDRVRLLFSDSKASDLDSDLEREGSLFCFVCSAAADVGRGREDGLGLRSEFSAFEDTELDRDGVLGLFSDSDGSEFGLGLGRDKVLWGVFSVSFGVSGFDPGREEDLDLRSGSSCLGMDLDREVARPCFSNSVLSDFDREGVRCRLSDSTESCRGRDRDED